MEAHYCQYNEKQYPLNYYNEKPSQNNVSHCLAILSHYFILK